MNKSSPPAKSLPAAAGGEGVEDDRGGCSLVTAYYKPMQLMRRPKNNHPLTSFAALLRRRATNRYEHSTTLPVISPCKYN